MQAHCVLNKLTKPYKNREGMPVMTDMIEKETCIIRNINRAIYEPNQLIAYPKVLFKTRRVHKLQVKRVLDVITHLHEAQFSSTRIGISVAITRLHTSQCTHFNSCL